MDNELETGLIGGVEKRDVVLCEYQPNWPELFRRHAEFIARAVGDAALQIEHIGSTSVPGLAAKPIIDILLVVERSDDESRYLPQLEAAGYQLRVREPEFHEHRMLRTAAKDVHIHVYSKGCPEVSRHLVFRNRLRSNDADRQQYEETKRQLAAQDWPDMNAYADAKGDVIERIIAAGAADLTNRQEC